MGLTVIRVPYTDPQNTLDTGVRPQGSLTGRRNVIYWFLQLATSHALARDAGRTISAASAGGGGTCSPRSGSRGLNEAWARHPGSGLPTGPTEEKGRAGLLRGSKVPAPTREVRAHADLPPPPTIQFFLQATFSCVVAASCRVASTNSLVLVASSLRRGSCSGISCG